MSLWRRRVRITIHQPLQRLCHAFHSVEELWQLWKRLWTLTEMVSQRCGKLLNPSTIQEILMWTMKCISPVCWTSWESTHSTRIKNQTLVQLFSSLLLLPKNSQL
uniref:Uncharacterized protein n=1 Tax=Cacopsylla melanoneura TaxID=428564 RepID=A0A8D8XBS1_9HEMI